MNIAADTGTAAHAIFERCMRGGRKTYAKAFIGQVIDTHKEERSHNLYSPSGSSRWLSCPGSLTLAAPAVPEARGAKITVNQEMAQTVQSALDYCWDLTVSPGERAQLFIEEEIDAGFTTGHLDLAIWLPKSRVLHVIDYKHGQGFVKADNNSQLQIYALALLHLDPITVTLHIAQPRIGSFLAWDTTPEDLLAFKKFAKQQIKISKSDTPLFTPTSDNCRYCQPTSCEAAISAAANAARSDFASFTSGKVKATPLNVSPKQLSQMLSAVPFLLMFTKALSEEVQKRIEAGHIIPGWRIGPGRSSREWKDIPQLELALAAIEISEDEYKPRTMIGITAMEKILPRKLKDTFMERHTIKPPGKPTLMPDDGSSAVDDFL